MCYYMFLYYFSFKILMWKKYFAIFFLLIFIFSTPLVSFASYHTKAIDNLVVDFTPIPTGVWPLDKIIKHKFIVTVASAKNRKWYLSNSCVLEFIFKNKEF